MSSFSCVVGKSIVLTLPVNSDFRSSLTTCGIYIFSCIIKFYVHSITKVYHWLQAQHISPQANATTINIDMRHSPIYILAMIASTSIWSSPYIEYKNKANIVDEPYTTSLSDKSINLNDSTDHLRLGYKLDNNMYFELGPMTHGQGYELGYKFSRDNWTIKGKIEGNHNTQNQFKNKLQTEIRYTFD